jgi:hypothetical protein
VSLGRGPVARMGGELIVRTPGSTGNARERHGLFRCGAFVRPALAAHRSRNALSPRTSSHLLGSSAPDRDILFSPLGFLAAGSLGRAPYRCHLMLVSHCSPSVSLLIADRVAGAWLSGGLAISAHRGLPLLPPSEACPRRPGLERLSGRGPCRPRYPRGVRTFPAARSISGGFSLGEPLAP